MTRHQKGTVEVFAFPAGWVVGVGLPAAGAAVGASTVNTQRKPT
jgi:hypothetical protein